MDRRNFIKTVGAAATVSTVVTGPWISNAMAQTGPIRIGLIAPLTGVLAAGGKELVEGFELYWKQNGLTIAGRPVEIVIEDDASNPDTALQKARRLVEQRNVDFMVGSILANTGLAIAEYAKTTGTPYFIPVVAADDLTQRKRIPNVVRVAGYSASQMPRPLADFAYKVKKVRKIVTISQDYTFGHEQSGGFSQTFTELGGKILQQFWHPLNTSDFSPYLAQIKNSGADAVFAMETGADANRFIKQYSNFGLQGKMPMFGAMNLTDQSVIRTLGKEATGIYSSAHFAEGSTNVATVRFVEQYQAAYNKLPSLYGFAAYSCAMWIAEALKLANGVVSDSAAFLKIINSIELTKSPLGRPVKLDSYGNPIYDVFIRETQLRPDGKVWNVPIEVYTGVSQFFNYDPETYMKQPSYSRDFQGIKAS
jgi:branched-chain amino acid transport system substrate-binding protein